ncbi:SufBD protein, partial [Candidatus Haloredivivus sp. G17]
MDSRAVIEDQSRSLYEGLQQVEESAVDTKSFQDQESLLLSDNAESDASPKLMIENPNVEASHAAATGNIQEDKAVIAIVSVGSGLQQSINSQTEGLAQRVGIVTPGSGGFSI